MSKRAASNARRIISTVQRVEQQPYDMTPRRREPRLGGGDVYLCCHVSGTLAAATGTWPSLTAGKVTGQQVYQAVLASNGTDYTLTPLPSSSSTINNFSATSFVTGKMTVVRRTGLADVFAVVVQDC